PKNRKRQALRTAQPRSSNLPISLPISLNAARVGGVDAVDDAVDVADSRIKVRSKARPKPPSALKVKRRQKVASKNPPFFLASRCRSIARQKQKPKMKRFRKPSTLSPLNLQRRVRRSRTLPSLRRAAPFPCCPENRYRSTAAARQDTRLSNLRQRSSLRASSVSVSDSNRAGRSQPVVRKMRVPGN